MDEYRVFPTAVPRCNYGEQPERDRELAAAIARGAVEWPEKLDGSLLIADRIAGAPRLRTRGRACSASSRPRSRR